MLRGGVGGRLQRGCRGPWLGMRAQRGGVHGMHGVHHAVVFRLGGAQMYMGGLLSLDMCEAKVWMHAPPCAGVRLAIQFPLPLSAPAMISVPASHPSPPLLHQDPASSACLITSLRRPCWRGVTARWSQCGVRPGRWPGPCRPPSPPWSRWRRRGGLWRGRWAHHTTHCTPLLGRSPPALVSPFPPPAWLYVTPGAPAHVSRHVHAPKMTVHACNAHHHPQCRGWSLVSAFRRSAAASLVHTAHCCRLHDCRWWPCC